MKHAQTQRIQRAIHALDPQNKRHQQPRAHQRANRGAHFGVAHKAVDAAFAHGHKVQRKVAAGQQHEDQRHAFKQRRVEIGKAGIVGRQSAQTHRGKHMHQRVQRLHAAGPEGQKTADGEQCIHTPQALGGFGNTRRELGILYRACSFCSEKLSTPDSQQRQNGHSQNQNPHAAHPLHKGAPDVDGHRQLIQPAKHGGARRRQARNRLKVGMGCADGNTHPVQAHQQGQHGAQRQHHPDQRHQNYAMARLQILLVAIQASP